jgi:hypothetical protein
MSLDFSVLRLTASGTSTIARACLRNLSPVRIALAMVLVAMNQGAVAASAPMPLTAEQQAVIAPVQALLSAVGAKDKAGLLAQVLPDGNATLVRNGKILHMSLAGLADGLSKLFAAHANDQLAEPMHDPLVLIDHNIAMVWGPYEAWIGGKMDHCGTNVFNLIQVDGQWKISGISDNSRKDCPVNAG